MKWVIGMHIQLEKINLSHIRLEPSLRDKVKDLKLQADIQTNGLQEPLSVEKEEEKYVLVDGYRRYDALKSVGIDTAWCIILEKSTEENRLIQKLRRQYHTKKLNRVEMRNVIMKLLKTKKYNEKLISQLFYISEKTIEKYKRALSINPDWLALREKTGAGLDGLIKIHELEESYETKEYIAKRFLGREFNSNVVYVISKATKQKEFQEIPEESVIDCVKQIIVNQSFETVNEIICEHSLLFEDPDDRHIVVYNKSIKLITSLEKIFRKNNFIKNLSIKQKAKLKKEVSNLERLLKPRE